MADTEQDPIIVTARFGGGFFQYFGFDPSQFLGGVGSFFVGGLTLANFYASNPKHFKIPGNQNKPETATNNLNSSQLAAVLTAVDNAEKDAGLDASFKEMASKNVKLTVTVQNQAPSWFDDPSSQVAGIRFSGIDTNNDGRPDSFSPNTTVEIVIVGSKVGNITQFKEFLAHELTHLIKRDSGNFLRELGVQGREGQTRNNLFSGVNESDYIDSMDYAVAVPGYGYNYVGTNGNNEFVDPGYYNEITTGAGNDIIGSGDYSDHVIVNGSGLKFVIDYGFGWDTLTAQTIPTMADVVWARVGLDLYITSRLSGVAPTSDPNAIILVDWYAAQPYGHIDYLKTANGEMIVLVDVAGQGVPAGAATYSFSDDSPISSASYSLGALEVGTWTFAGAAGRYRDVTSYTSHAVDSSAILSELASAAIMQLSTSRPGVEDQFAGLESSRPSIQADLGSHLWQVPVHQLIGPVDVAFV
jgi:hypothetical protein